MDTALTDALASYGPWTLIGFAVLAVFRGFLLPRSVVEDLRAELTYSRARVRELEEQRDLARAEAARLGITLTNSLVAHDGRAAARESST